jgi:hypothetical protein
MLKLKDGFILRQIGDEVMVIPSGAALDLDMMITLNETGRFIWDRLEVGTTEEALAAQLQEEYDVDEEIATSCVHAFVEKLNDYGFLD